jgi:hypothetical protein
MKNCHPTLRRKCRIVHVQNPHVMWGRLIQATATLPSWKEAQAELKMPKDQLAKMQLVLVVPALPLGY